MYAIENKENFELELTALLAKIDDVIASTRDTIGVKAGLPSTSAINKINSLKVEEYRLKEISLNLVNMDKEEWESKKAEFQKTFLAAKDAMAARDAV